MSNRRSLSLALGKIRLRNSLRISAATASCPHHRAAARAMLRSEEKIDRQLYPQLYEREPDPHVFQHGEKMRIAAPSDNGKNHTPGKWGNKEKQ